MIKSKVRRLFLSLLCGVVSGLSAAAFLYLLNWATHYRENHMSVLWFLPVAGFCVSFLYLKFGRNVAAGNNIIIEEIQDPKKVVPIRMAPFILIGTVASHFFGASTGREGTAVQMGSSLTDQLTILFKLSTEERRALLAAAAGASFGAAIGAPAAGTVFGMEMISVGRFKIFALIESALASFVAYYLVLFLGVKHTVFPGIGSVDYGFNNFLYIIAAGALFGYAARFFTLSTRVFERSIGFLKYAPLKTFAVGILIVACFYLEGTFRFAGLGLETIQKSFADVQTFSVPLLKSVFTTLSVGSGFKGGEFIPLVFVGSSLGSALSIIFPMSIKVLAAVGFAAVFAGASNTPIACSLMAIELFGFSIAPFAFLACGVSYVCSGPLGIYQAQLRRHVEQV